MTRIIGILCAALAAHGRSRDACVPLAPPVSGCASQRGRRIAWHPGRTALAFALVSCFPCVLLSSEPAMEIFVDRASLAISGISPQTVRDMAKANDLSDPDRWPVYNTTGHPDYRLPASFVRHAKDHPAWDLKRLGEYRIAFRHYSDGDREQRVVFLYRRQANVLFVLYEDIPKKENDPNSPF